VTILANTLLTIEYLQVVGITPGRYPHVLWLLTLQFFVSHVYVRYYPQKLDDAIVVSEPSPDLTDHRSLAADCHIHPTLFPYQRLSPLPLTRFPTRLGVRVLREFPAI